MEFLPIEKDGFRVYAGFWKRFGALWVDVLVVVFFIWAFHWLESVSLPMAMLGIIGHNIAALGYTIYFHYRFGATLGKMATGIKVTLPNGNPIGLIQAFLRSSVDLGYTVLVLTATLIAFGHADPDQYLSADRMERAVYVSSRFPDWYGIVAVGIQLWTWSEVVVLLLNKRRRALHDFIAGTVVIRKQYAAARDNRPDTADTGPATSAY